MIETETGTEMAEIIIGTTETTETQETTEITETPETIEMEIEIVETTGTDATIQRVKTNGVVEWKGRANSHNGMMVS